jgi:hypothetical protein
MVELFSTDAAPRHWLHCICALDRCQGTLPLYIRNPSSTLIPTMQHVIVPILQLQSLSNSFSFAHGENTKCTSVNPISRFSSDVYVDAGERHNETLDLASTSYSISPPEMSLLLQPEVTTSSIGIQQFCLLLTLRLLQLS